MTSNIRNTKSTWLILLVVILVMAFLAYLLYPSFQSDENNVSEVQTTVETFGRRLQNVPLMSENEILSESMQEQYGDLVVSQVVINNWLSDPSNAPGRLTSSPWPNHIEILNTEKLSDNTYEVKGNVIEITSNELSEECVTEKGINTQNSGCEIIGFAAKRPINILLERLSDDKRNPWLITSVAFGQYISNGNENEYNYAGWQTKQDESTGVSYKFLQELPASYIRGENWPPVVTVDSSIHELACKITASGNSLPETLEEKTIAGHVYCIYSKAEGAAGSVYTEYNYSTIKDNSLVSVSFTLQYPQCENYSGQQQTDCKNELEGFDLGALTDKLIASVEF